MRRPDRSSAPGERSSALRVVPAHSVLSTRSLRVESRTRTILRDVDLDVRGRGVHAIIGPSGAGKSTLLRCLNRLVDLDEGLAVSGRVEYHGRSIHDRGLDVDDLRARIGILFQQPVVLPGSVADNTVFGLRRLRRLSRRELRARAEVALRRAALWAEVEDRLDEPAMLLSVGQRQRLCLARALAVEPEVLLMDEPTSALDWRSTEAIEELILELKRDLTIVLVTHDLEQARRVADVVGCLCLRGGAGELAESAVCSDMFAAPQNADVIDFLNRRSDSHE